MSQTIEQEPSRKHGLSTKSVMLLVLIIGIGAGAVAYELGLAITANAQNTATSQTPTSPYWAHDGRSLGDGRFGTSTGFIARSTAANVTVTGFNIVSSNQITVTLSYGGGGTAPALTISALAPYLSGSTTVAAGWGASTTVTVNLTGSGSLATMRHIAVLVVPYTA